MGPSCWDVPCLEDLIDLGLSVARFNFSHGDHEGHKACLDRVREAAANKKKHVGKIFPLVHGRESFNLPFSVLSFAVLIQSRVSQ
jgi:hypothetical protein